MGRPEAIMPEFIEITFSFAGTVALSCEMEVQRGGLFKVLVIETRLEVLTASHSVTPLFAIVPRFCAIVPTISRVCGANSVLAPQLARGVITIPRIVTTIRGICGAIFKIAPQTALGVMTILVIFPTFSQVLPPIPPVCGAKIDLAPQMA